MPCGFGFSTFWAIVLLISLPACHMKKPASTFDSCFCLASLVACVYCVHASLCPPWLTFLSAPILTNVVFYVRWSGGCLFGSLGLGAAIFVQGWCVYRPTHFFAFVFHCSSTAAGQRWPVLIHVPIKRRLLFFPAFNCHFLNILTLLIGATCYFMIGTNYLSSLQTYKLSYIHFLGGY